MTVYRSTALPDGPSRGRLVVSDAVSQNTLRALREFRGPDGRHEGLVYWAGIRSDGDSIVVCNFVPRCDHGPLRVMAPPDEIGRINSTARTNGLVVVAQVHSHPGDDTRHSDGDDHLVPMPYEGMFSLVVARYGDGSLSPGEGVGIHQYQNRRWIHISPEYASIAMSVIPSVG